MEFIQIFSESSWPFLPSSEAFNSLCIYTIVDGFFHSNLLSIHPRLCLSSSGVFSSKESLGAQPAGPYLQKETHWPDLPNVTVGMAGTGGLHSHGLRCVAQVVNEWLTDARNKHRKCALNNHCIIHWTVVLFCLALKPADGNLFQAPQSESATAL